MQPEFIALSIVLLLFSVIVHEVCHGLAALYFGDHTAEDAGRLTLNPIPHIDPIGTILIPGVLFLTGSPVLFGWAKPVPVNPLNFSKIKTGELVVALAGVGANFALATIAAILLHILSNFYINPLAFRLLFYMVNVNLVLTVFNLLPIPPLDGSKVLMSQLSYKHAREFALLERYAIFIFLAMWYNRIGGTSIMELILGTGVSFLRTILGL